MATSAEVNLIPSGETATIFSALIYYFYADTDDVTTIITNNGSGGEKRPLRVTQDPSTLNSDLEFLEYNVDGKGTIFINPDWIINDDTAHDILDLDLDGFFFRFEGATKV